MYIWDILWLSVHVYGVLLLVYFAVLVFIVQLCLSYSDTLGLILKTWAESISEYIGAHS